MAVALYRKYRSRSLDEVLGQEHITKPLSQALKKGQISHAYLFTGPRGVGKTSVARLLAYALNDLPYQSDQHHLDIIEIDAASNRRIDEIRDLREKINTAPAMATYKVYIIDEVHMLTREAFNALLKTLEEPPEHAIFILATTEAHKLPATIISRTQRYAFHPIKPEVAAKHLRQIAKAEKIKIDDDALQLIAERGDGSFRDSISLLDQVQHAGSDTITAEMVRQLIGAGTDKLVVELVAAVERGSIHDVNELLSQSYGEGLSASVLAEQLVALLQEAAIKTGSGDKLQLAEDLLSVGSSTRPAIALKLVLLRASLAGSPEPAKPSKPVSEPAEKKPKVASTTVSQATVTAKPQAEKPEPTPLNAADATPLESAQWQAILEGIRKENNALFSIVRSATAKQQGDRLILSVQFPFHAKRINEARNKGFIQEAATQTLGRATSAEAVVASDYEAPAQIDVKPAETNSAVADVLAALGGGEVVQL